MVKKWWVWGVSPQGVRPTLQDDAYDVNYIDWSGQGYDLSSQEDGHEHTGELMFFLEHKELQFFLKRKTTHKREFVLILSLPVAKDLFHYLKRHEHVLDG